MSEVIRVAPDLRPRSLIKQWVVNAWPPTSVKSMTWPRAPLDCKYISRCWSRQLLRDLAIPAADSLLMTHPSGRLHENAYSPSDLAMITFITSLVPA